MQARLQWLTETGKRLEVASDSSAEDTVQTCLATVALGTRLRQALKEVEAHVDWASSVILKSVHQVGNPLLCIPGGGCASVAFAGVPSLLRCVAMS